MEDALSTIDDGLRVYNDINSMKHSTFEITEGNGIIDAKSDDEMPADAATGAEFAKKVRGTIALPVGSSDEALRERIRTNVQHSRRNLSALLLTDGRRREEWERVARCLYEALRWSPKSEPTVIVFERPLCVLVQTFPNLQFTGEHSSCMTKVYPSAITPSLYIGGVSSASSATVLKRTRVTHVVNCTKDMPNFFEPRPQRSVASYAADALRGAGQAVTTWFSSLSASNNASFPRPQKSHTPARRTVRDLEPGVEPPKGVKYFRVPVDDQLAPIEVFFEESFQFISDALRSKDDPKQTTSETTSQEIDRESQAQKNVVLVHCVCGISRSVTILTHFLMRSRRMSFDEAYGLVKSMRDEARPNRHFEALLRKVDQRV